MQGQLLSGDTIGCQELLCWRADPVKGMPPPSQPVLMSHMTAVGMVASGLPPPLSSSSSSSSMAPASAMDTGATQSIAAVADALGTPTLRRRGTLRKTSIMPVDGLVVNDNGTPTAHRRSVLGPGGGSNSNMSNVSPGGNAGGATGTPPRAPDAEGPSHRRSLLSTATGAAGSTRDNRRWSVLSSAVSAVGTAATLSPAFVTRRRSIDMTGAAAFPPSPLPKQARPRVSGADGDEPPYDEPPPMGFTVVADSNSLVLAVAVQHAKTLLEDCYSRLRFQLAAARHIMREVTVKEERERIAALSQPKQPQSHRGSQQHIGQPSAGDGSARDGSGTGAPAPAGPQKGSDGSAASGASGGGSGGGTVGTAQDDADGVIAAPTRPTSRVLFRRTRTATEVQWVVDFLTANRFYSRMSPAALRQLAAIVTLRTVGKGELGTSTAAGSHQESLLCQ